MLDWLYRGLPEEPEARMRLGQRIAIISMISAFFFLIVGSVYLPSSVALLGAFVFLVIMFLSIPIIIGARVNKMEDDAVLKIRQTIKQMGFSQTESLEIADIVVTILKSGRGGDVTEGIAGPVGIYMDAKLATVNWTDYTSSDLAIAIDMALKIRRERNFGAPEIV